MKVESCVEKTVESKPTYLTYSDCLKKEGVYEWIDEYCYHKGWYLIVLKAHDYSEKLNAIWFNEQQKKIGFADPEVWRNYKYFPTDKKVCFGLK